MKIRTGFVANSSSSSFIILGVYSEPDDNGLYEGKTVEQWEAIGLDTRKMNSWDEKTERMIGKYIAHGDECYDSLKVKDFNDRVKVASDIIKLSGLNLDDVAIYYGDTDRY